MPALNPNNTERWWAVYTVNSTEHRLMVRTADGATNTGVSSAIGGIWTRVATDLADVVPLGLERALRGTNVRNPFPWTGAASYGTGNFDDNFGRDLELTMTGRTFGGHKSRISIYGYKLGGQGDYRIDITENVGIANLVTYLNGATGFALAIDGSQPVWHNYGNAGLNDHWVKKHRG